MLEQEVIRLTNTITLLRERLKEKGENFCQTPLRSVADPGILTVAGGCGESRNLLSLKDQQTDNEGTKKC